MISTTTSIAKGIRFSAIESHKFKADVLTFSITLPMTAKTVAYNTLLSGLMRRGTVMYPSMSELNRSLDELYGSYVEIRSSNIGNNVSFTISSEILDNQYITDGVDTLGGVIGIVSQIILTPLITSPDFNRDFFASECKIFIDNLDAEQNNTRSYSIRRCLELLQADTPNPTLEELREIVRTATFEDVLAHYFNMISCAPLDVFYIGATSPYVVGEQIAQAFAAYPSNSFDAKLNPIEPIAHREIRDKVEKMPVVQGKLTMGFNIGCCISREDDKYYTALLLNEIFGGSASSKLFLNVRERMGLCYYCSSSYSIYTGIMPVSCGIESDKAELVRNAVLEQLEQIKQGNISGEELLNAKKSLTNTYSQLADNPFDLQTFYAGRSLFGISDTINTCIEKLWRVEISDITSLASNISLDAVFFVEGTNQSAREEFDDE